MDVSRDNLLLFPPSSYSKNSFFSPEDGDVKDGVQETKGSSWEDNSYVSLWLLSGADIMHDWLYEITDLSTQTGGERTA